MRLCVTGLKDVVIARRLGVSVVTVRRRAQSFRRRVGAQNRPQAVAIATRLGWLPETSSSAAPISTTASRVEKPTVIRRDDKSSGGG